MYSYFQTFSSSGYWTPIATPAHFISGTGDIAFCLQPAKQSPYGSSYYSINGTDYYDDVTLKGLQAILEHGYPNDWGGFDEEGAWYATANAIRFWLAERGAEGSLFWMDLSQYREFFSDITPYEDLWFWCLDLVQYARDQDVTQHIVSFSPAELTLEQQGDYFMGETTVSVVNCSGGYTLDTSALPSGSTVTGFTGRSGDTLTIKVPSEYAEESYNLSAEGIDNHTRANLLFYAPSNYQQQRVVTYDVSIFSEATTASMKVNTPESAIKTGSITIRKIDAETGKTLTGVSFNLYDEAKNQLAGGETDNKGIITFPDLPLGKYYYKEISTLAGYVTDEAMHEVEVSGTELNITVTVENTKAKGSVAVSKVDAVTGNPLSGVHFILRNSIGDQVGGGNTNGEGKISFTDLPLGDYVLIETTTLDGYVLDDTEIPVTISEDGQIVEITRENSPISGSLEIIKKDAYEDIRLSGAGFRLYSSDGEQIEEGYTDRDGILSFGSLPRGDYYYKEFKPPMGYLLDEAVYLFSIEENGETVIHTRDNLRREGTLQVKKQDSDGSVLPGAAFSLEFSTDGGSTWKPVFAREDDGNVTCGGCTSPGLADGELVSGTDGIAVFTGLRADTKTLYRLTETKAPDGHSLVAGSLYVGTLPVEVDDPNTSDSEHFGEKTYTYTIYNTVTDCPVFRLPETGGSGFVFYPITMLLTAATILITFKRRKTD